MATQTEQKRRLIWTSIVDTDDYSREDYEDMCEINEIDPRDWSFEQYCYDDNEEMLNVEKFNLDRDVDGTILAFVNMGLWNGRRHTIYDMGDNIADAVFGIADKFQSIADADFYALDGDVMADLMHHDGTHGVVFRVFKGGGEELEELMDEARASGDDAELYSNTESLYKYVADIYGWQ